MVVCLKCDSEDCVRDGIVKGQQRHRCKGCGYKHIVTQLAKSSDDCSYPVNFEAIEVQPLYFR